MPLKHTPVAEPMPTPQGSEHSATAASSEAAAGMVARMRQGERRALAEAVTRLETMSADAPALLAALRPHLGHALVIGITGPPGAGKSTLVDAYVRAVRRTGARVAIIAVDPSSPVSGGAILGDRIRMSAALDDDGVVMRSLASGGHLGGLSPAAVRIIDAFDAAGTDLIVLETVGTGQTEIDIAEIADVRVVVTAPGLGDDIQAMKSGLLEIADILVVNKADREGAERTVHQLLGALSLRAVRPRAVPVLKTTALSGAGLEALCEAIAACQAAAAGLDATTRRRRRARYLIARAAADEIAARVRDGARAGLDVLADEILAGTLSPAAAARRLLAE